MLGVAGDGSAASTRPPKSKNDDSSGDESDEAPFFPLYVVFFVMQTPNWFMGLK